MVLLSSFTRYSQFSLFTFWSLTSVPDFGLTYPTFRLHLWQLHSCWHGGNSSACSLRITTVSGMFPVASFPCIYVCIIELRIMTVSVCHICSACPCCRESLYTSGLVSVSPSHHHFVLNIFILVRRQLPQTTIISSYKTIKEQHHSFYEQSPLNTYPPMPRSEIDLKYIPINPLYPPWHCPSLPFRLGEDILRTGAGTWYIGITAWDPTLAYISLPQDGTLSHYSQLFPPDNIIDPEMCHVLKRCMRVGRAAWLLLKEIVLLFKACAPQWWWQWRGRDIWRVCPKFKQLKKIKSQVEMLKRKDSMDMTTETFSPWFWWIILWLISFVTQQTFPHDSLI